MTTMAVFSAPPALPPRPDGSPASTLTITQSFHEWVHALEAAGWDIADGSRGKPSYPADRDALAAMQQSFASLVTVSPYGTSPLGEPQWQQQAAEGFSREYGVDVAPETVVFTPGGQFGLAASFYAIERANPGSVILAPQPWYLNHEELASLFVGDAMLTQGRNAKFIGMDMLSTGGRMTPELLERGLSAVEASGKKLGAFLFCNPSNPLGTVIRKGEWAALAPILRRFPDVPILLDEAFAEIIFDEDFKSSLLHAAPDLQDRIFLFRSGTKALGLAGERLAAMIVPPRYLPAVTAFQSRLLGNAPLTLQAGMSAALAKIGAQKKSFITQYYRANFHFLRDRLQQYGLWGQVPVGPEGGFFLLLGFENLKGTPLPEMAANLLGKSTIETDTDLAFALLMGLGLPEGHARSEGVAVIPASAFGVAPERMLLRISYSSSREEISRIAERIGRAVASIAANEF
jgi:aspartate/methionine/tyrosine aminotransferase